MRQMAVVAGGDGVMRAFRPPGELIVHDVAVDAGLGIVAEIAKPFGVIEREGSEPQHGAQGDCDDDPRPGEDSPHLDAGYFELVCSK